jgi:hypothetical protein
MYTYKFPFYTAVVFWFYTNILEEPTASIYRVKVRRVRTLCILVRWRIKPWSTRKDNQCYQYPLALPINILTLLTSTLKVNATGS